MRLTPVCALALVMAGCATTGVSTRVSQPSGISPANQTPYKTAVQQGDVAAFADPPAASTAQPRPKTSASGARLAEEWSPALGAALRRYIAAPSVRNEVELARVYREAGILDQAYDHYEAAARQNPREAAAWDGLARVWRDWGYPELGLGDAHRAVWADPRSPVVRNTLGTILQLLGKNLEAREQYAQAVALDPAAAYAHYNLAVVCTAERKYAAAAEEFERAAALDPSLEIARTRAREARQRASDEAAGKGGTHEHR